MIPGYDFYAEEEDPSLRDWPFAWVVHMGSFDRISSAGPFTDDADAAKQLAYRRKVFPGYTVKLLKDGQVWEPQS